MLANLHLVSWDDAKLPQGKQQLGLELSVRLSRVENPEEAEYNRELVGYEASYLGIVAELPEYAGHFRQDLLLPEVLVRGREDVHKEGPPAVPHHDGPMMWSFREVHEEVESVQSEVVILRSELLDAELHDALGYEKIFRRHTLAGEVYQSCSCARGQAHVVALHHSDEGRDQHLDLLHLLILFLPTARTHVLLEDLPADQRPEADADALGSQKGCEELLVAGDAAVASLPG
mmetsp:Transcript_35335/g.77251  ORF Transcript_35335/g.77251 Transcript_35335/m.77251 type:complete len:232 (+) Transcript_35335:351-1046(+)